MDNLYKNIRFIGYAIPTVPDKLVSIGDPNGPGAVAGTFLANNDMSIDISRRIAIMKNAVDTAKSQLPPGETDVVNLFVAPEFYFHGVEGPYVYNDVDKDPMGFVKQELASTFNPTEYPNWIFICGSVITMLVKDINVVFNSNSAKVRNNIVENLAKQWQASFGPLKGVIFDMLINFIKNGHGYPNCEVRNRSAIVSNIPIRTPEVDEPVNLMSTEKYFASNEDFLLYDVTGKQVVTEQMIAYPLIDLSAGDAKQSPFDVYAIFRQNNINPSNPIATTVMDYGVEICLDHSDVRLRRNVNNEPNVIGGIHVQVIPSCGMQISLPSVATDKNGLVFNCDGQYNLGDSSSGHGILNEVDCLYANYKYNSMDGISYQAHSQVARVDAPPIGGDPNAAGSSNATFTPLDVSLISTFKVPMVKDLGDYFAGGPGEVHIYGLSNPFVLYP